MKINISERNKHLARRLRGVFSGFGFEPLKTFQALRAVPGFIRDFSRFQKHMSAETGEISLYPCLHDRYDESGSTRGHYFHQDLFVAGKIFTQNPVRHVDIGSRIDGFVSHLASFREIEVFDIRPKLKYIQNVVFRVADFTSPLPVEFHNYADSVSCLHALEHFGLGRYGDQIDPEGFKKGVKNLLLICKPEGTVFISVPIGPARVEFNAHRVFNTAYLFDFLKQDFKIKAFSYIDDQSELHKDVSPSQNDLNTSFNCQFGCGIFELEKTIT